MQQSLFDSAWYIDRYPDVNSAFRTGVVGTPLRHFLAWGSAEDRQPGPDFVPSAYPDPDGQSRKGGGIFRHLLRTGGVSGRIGVIER